MFFYIGSFFVACLGIGLLLVLNRLEKLEIAHKSYSLYKANASMSAFSASAPAFVSTDESTQKLQKYKTVHINGGDFNEDTGVFTCSTPGLYYFTATLVKKRDSQKRLDQVYCYIYKNDAQQLLLKVNPTDDDTDLGHAAITNSIILKLVIDDTVYLGNCNSINHFANWTSFSGFLLYPES